MGEAGGKPQHPFRDHLESFKNHARTKIITWTRRCRLHGDNYAALPLRSESSSGGNAAYSVHTSRRCRYAVIHLVAAMPLT